MIRGGAALLVLGLALHGAGCGSEQSDPDTFCCALKQICSLCDCSLVPGVSDVADANEGDACRFVLEDNELDCAMINEETALANCVDR